MNFFSTSISNMLTSLESRETLIWTNPCGQQNDIKTKYLRWDFPCATHLRCYTLQSHTPTILCFLHKLNLCDHEFSRWCDYFLQTSVASDASCHQHSSTSNHDDPTCKAKKQISLMGPYHTGVSSNRREITSKQKQHVSGRVIYCQKMAQVGSDAYGSV